MISLVSRAASPVFLLALLFAAGNAAAQALVRMPEGYPSGGQSFQAADPPPFTPVSPEEQDRLIDAYVREAGKPGKNQWFSTPRVILRGSVGEAYDDNILVSADRDKESDAVTTLAAGIGVAVGDFTQRRGSFIAADYQASAMLFGIHSEENSVDHSASGDLQYRWDKLAVRGTSGFQSLHETSADLGQRTQRSVFDEALDAKYDLGAYTRVEAAVRYNYTDYDSPIDTQDLLVELGADYLFFDKLRLGAQVSGGRTEASGSSGGTYAQFGPVSGGRVEASGGVQETYEQFQARIEYEVTGRIKVRTRLGFEIRQREGGTGDSVDPVFSLEGVWNPFDGTSFDLEGYRRVAASASVAGDDILATGLHFSLRQRLVTRFYVQLDGDYTHAEYQRAASGASRLARTDDYYLVRGAVGYDFVDWFKVQLFCQRRQNDSVWDNFSFESTRSGVQVDLAY